MNAGGTGANTYLDNSSNQTLRFAVHSSGVTTDFRSCIDTDNGSRSPPIYDYTGNDVHQNNEMGRMMYQDDDKTMVMTMIDNQS